jgi:mannan endo-1,4-beta-mannosidase
MKCYLLNQNFQKLLISTFCTLLAVAPAIGQIDKQATKETKALYKNLRKLSRKHILFGHQHATEYGSGWRGENNRSDVKSVTGSHPAIIGVDFMGLSGLSKEKIAENKLKLKKNVEATYNRGGVTTVAWHMANPASEGGFYWVDSVSAPAISMIKVGGSHHEEYKDILNTIGDFANSVKGKDGKAVPMIFRPFHEFDGKWFWWGSPHTSREDFMSVWQFTVSYLRDSLNVHNFLYAFSPDNKFLTEEEFLERYPGDNYVDMVGMDNYADFGRNDKYDVGSGIKKLKIVSDYAQKSNKLAAFTETGLESIPNPTWWTETLLKSLKAEDIRLAYVLVWRNDDKNKVHYYAPYPGQTSVPDFMKFYDDPYTLFESGLKDIYRRRFLGIF